MIAFNLIRSFLEKSMKLTIHELEHPKVNKTKSGMCLRGFQFDLLENLHDNIWVHVQ